MGATTCIFVGLVCLAIRSCWGSKDWNTEDKNSIFQLSQLACNVERVKKNKIIQHHRVIWYFKIVFVVALEEDPNIFKFSLMETHAAVFQMFQSAAIGLRIPALIDDWRDVDSGALVHSWLESSAARRLPWKLQTARPASLAQVWSDKHESAGFLLIWTRVVSLFSF